MLILIIAIYLWFSLVVVLSLRLGLKLKGRLLLITSIIFPVIFVEIHSEYIRKEIGRTIDRLTIKFINLLDAIRGGK